MVVNCYYSQWNAGKWSALFIYERVYEKLVSKYKDIEFKSIDGPVYCKQNNIPLDTGGTKYGYHHMTLENAENGKYFTISYYDHLESISEENGWDIENCVEIFTSSGAHNTDISYTPISYPICYFEIEQYIENIQTTYKRKNFFSKAKFRGSVYEFREYLQSNHNFIIQDNSSRFEPKEYIEELNCSSVNISPNGRGEITHRDIECFGVGSAVVRQKLTTQFHNTLIPGYHYEPVEYSDILDLQVELFYKELSNRFYDKYNELLNNTDKAEFLATNARKWYLENGTVEKNSTLIVDLLNFTKLT